MKTLLSILLICGLSGQSRLDSVKFNQLQSLDWKSEYLSTGLIYLYEHYEIECYNDSSQVVRHIGGDSSLGNGCWGWSQGWGTITCANPSHYDKKAWIHKEPKFHGFMEWLKEKQ